LECGSLLPLSSSELARGLTCPNTRSCERPASWPQQKRQQAAALQSACGALLLMPTEDIVADHRPELLEQVNWLLAAT